MYDTETRGLDTFGVPLQGWMVECDSIEDAAAIERADAILSGQDFVDVPAELVQVAAVCRRYGRRAAADILIGQASRLRAAAFLQDSVGYERPVNR